MCDDAAMRFGIRICDPKPGLLSGTDCGVPYRVSRCSERGSEVDAKSGLAGNVRSDVSRERVDFRLFGANLDWRRSG